MLNRHDLALFVMAADPDAPGERAATLLDHLRAAGFVDGERPAARPLVDGGFALARAEVFPRERFVANRQGGFHVRCPADGSNVVPRFNKALEAWRVGGPRALECACGATHDLAALDYRPPAGFARGWVVLTDVGGAELTAAALALAEGELGRVRVVGRRG